MALPSFRLKPEDSVQPALSLVEAPADPQAEMIRLMDLLRAVDAARDEIQKVCTNWSADPVGTLHRVQTRAIELQQLIPQATVLGQALSMALRDAGLYGARVGSGDRGR